MSDNNGEGEGQDLYDEFGNYIGPDLDSDSSDEEEEESDIEQREQDEVSDIEDADDEGAGVGTSRALIERSDEIMQEQEEITASAPNAIVLHEDKEHYLSASQVYGEEVTTAVLDEDAMDIDTPIIEPVSTKSHYYATKKKKGTAIDADDNEWLYGTDYLGVQLSNETTRTRRGIAVVGHLHHGKTTLIDSILEPTRKRPWDVKTASSDGRDGQSIRFTDTLLSERKRQMSLVSCPITTLLNDTRGKSYCVTIVDNPGHPNFHDESVASLKLVDGACLVVDIVEGINMIHTKMLIKQIVLTDGLPICLVLTKMDRLIVELKLPPRDAYYKILNVIESINEYIGEISNGRYPTKLSPERGNVAFSCAQHGWMFTLESYAQLYLDHHDDEYGLGKNLSTPEFATRLWGDSYMCPRTRQFYKSSRDCKAPTDRTFVKFVLEPIYKVYSACLGERPEPDVNQMLRSVGVFLKRDELRASARPLLRQAMSKFMGGVTGFTDMIVKNVSHPMAASPAKVLRCYTGPLHNDDDSDGDSNNSNKIVQAMSNCDPNGPLIIHVTKMYSQQDGQSFLSFGRIYSGTVRPSTQVKVLGESYDPSNDEEDCSTATISNVAVPRGRDVLNISILKAGNWVLLEGIDSTISKTATIVGSDYNGSEPIHIFKPLQFPQCGGESIVKLAIEPLQPAELPKMVEGLRRITKAYPMSKTKVEESGEHVVMGTGELYLDCIMYDLRHVYSNIEIKVADPIVAFRETCVETSSVKCFSETTNRKNKLTMIAEPLDEGLAEQLENGKLSNEWDTKKMSRYFQKKYNWDLLSSRSVWAFGDSPTRGPNIIMDDTLPSEVDKKLLNSPQIKSSIVRGFQWATREGPLCEEPVRGTKLKILDVTLADKPVQRGGGQMIPTARKVVHSSILTATPQLMEPIYKLQIQCSAGGGGNSSTIVDAIQPLLTRRRGHIVQDKPIPGTTFHTVNAYLPVLDSFGFETDLRTFTQGQAMVFSTFDHWSVVPGDPLDKSIILHPLEPSPAQHLARELLIKTRRRKGLSEDVSITKFFTDDGMKAHLATATTITQ